MTAERGTMSSILLAMLATVLFLVAGGVSFFSDFPWLSALVTGIFALLLPFLVTFLSKEEKRENSEAKKSGFALLWLLPLFVGVTFSLSLFCQWIGAFFDITLPTYTGALPFLLFAHALIPAVTEEFCFRGVLPRLLSPLGKGAELWGAAILFAIAHVSPVMMCYALVAGLFLGLVREYTKAPYLSMVFHFVNNGFCLVLMQFPSVSPVLAAGLVLGLGVVLLGAVYLKNPKLLKDFLAPLRQKKETR